MGSIVRLLCRVTLWVMEDLMRFYVQEAMDKSSEAKAWGAVGNKIEDIIFLTSRLHSDWLFLGFSGRAAV